MSPDAATLTPPDAAPTSPTRAETDLQALWNAHLALAPTLKPGLCQRVLGLSPTTRADWVRRAGLRRRQLSLVVRPKRPAEAAALAAELNAAGLAGPALVAWAQDFIAPHPDWAPTLAQAHPGDPPRQAWVARMERHPPRQAWVARMERHISYHDRAVATGQLQLPDPWTGEPCCAVDGFSAFGRSAYLFIGRQPFYLLTAGAGSRAMGLFLPGPGLWLDLGVGLPHLLGDGPFANTMAIVLERLARHRLAYQAMLARPAAQRLAPRAPWLYLGSIENFAHHHWNFLPGLERQLLAGRGERIGRVFTSGSEFFGPLTGLYPELAGRHQHLGRQRLTDPCPFSADALFVAVGGYYIPASLRQRLLAGARRLPPTPGALQPEQLPADAGPVIWLGLRVASRSWVGQEDGVVQLIRRLAQTHPRAVFLLDGFSLPSGEDHISAQWAPARVALQALAEGIRARCAAEAPSAQVHSLVGNRLRESVLLAARVTLYLAPIGTTQHKVGWLASGPGLVYSGADIDRIALWRRPGSWEAEGQAVPDWLVGQAVEAGEQRHAQDRRNNLHNITLDVDAVAHWMLQRLGR